MIKVTYKDATIDEFSSANDWEYSDNDDNIFHILIRKFDKEGDYDEDEDETIAWIQLSEIRKIEKC